jgi:antirestriction protein ArdC
MSKKYNRIVELISKAMEDELTWRKTWQSQSRLHCNWLSKRAYTGTNQIMTMISAWVNDYTSPYWVTFNQAKDLGGSVKGQTATPAVFFGTGTDRDDPEKMFKFAKVYNLFNLDQIGIEVPPVQIRTSKLERPYEIVEALNVGLDCNASNNPCYSPVTDKIKMPMPGQFESDDDHQSTLYHECIHATGHSKRLDRPLTGMFGSEDYAKEELVAELGSVFLCAELGVSYDLKQHASYLQSWQKAIKDDPQYILKAASAAQKAVEYVMSQFTMKRKYEEAA